jgi:hypothetical protein
VKASEFSSGAFSIPVVASIIKEDHKFYDIAFDLVDQGSLGSDHATSQAGLFTGGRAKIFLGFQSVQEAFNFCLKFFSFFDGPLLRI